jgi:hypothetical protein
MAGFTQVRGSGFIGAGSALVSNGWVVDGSIANFFKYGDVLALRVSQPLRVAGGGMNFQLPVAYDYDAGAVWVRRLSLAPTGREVDAELAWQFPLKGGSAGLNLFWRRDPGHYAALPDDGGVSMTWRKGFFRECAAGGLRAGALNNPGGVWLDGWFWRMALRR